MTAAPRRRWFRFSLRTLFAVVTVFAVFGWFGWNLHQVREREGLLASLSSRGAMFGRNTSGTPPKPLPLVWTLLGAKPIGVIQVPDSAFTEDDLHRIATLFPEATIHRDRRMLLEPPLPQIFEIDSQNSTPVPK